MSKRKRSPSTLRLLREQRGLTQSEVGDRIEYEQTMMSFFERGEVIPSDETLQRLAEVLGYPGDPADLLLPIPEFLEKEDGRRTFDAAGMLAESS